MIFLLLNINNLLDSPDRYRSCAATNRFSYLNILINTEQLEVVFFRFSMVHNLVSPSEHNDHYQLSAQLFLSFWREGREDNITT